MYSKLTFDDVIELKAQIETIQNNEVIKSWVSTTVYANKKSVRQSENYQAAAAGLKPELVFVIHSFEYDNQKKIGYDNKEYTVIRAYDTGEFTELTVIAFTGSDV